MMVMIKNNNDNHKHKIRKYCWSIKNALKTRKKTWDNVQVVHFPEKKFKENQNILFVWLKELLLMKFIFNSLSV